MCRGNVNRERERTHAISYLLRAEGFVLTFQAPVVFTLWKSRASEQRARTKVSLKRVFKVYAKSFNYFKMNAAWETQRELLNFSAEIVNTLKLIL